MKLEDWWDKWMGYSDETVPDEATNGLHVIGTCSSCVWHKPCETGSDWMYGQCYKNVHSFKNGSVGKPETFGCIHWSAMEFIEDESKQNN